MVKTKKGGYRIGAGRKKGEPTNIISFRVKEKNVMAAKRKIKDILKNL